MPNPSYNDLDDALRHTKFVPKESFKEDLRVRLQQRNRRREDPAFSSNGWRRPLSIQPTHPIKDKTVSNSRLISIFAASFVMVLVVVLAGAILMPRTPIAEVVAPSETGEFRADEVSDIAGVWSYYRGGLRPYYYYQFNQDGTGYHAFYAEERGHEWLVMEEPNPHNTSTRMTGAFEVWFEEGYMHMQYTIANGEALNEDAPIGVWEVYITKQNGQLVSMRAVEIEDKHIGRRGLLLVGGKWLGPGAALQEGE